MTVKRPSLLCATALSLMLALPVGGAALLMTAATPALAQASLPAPYVSRALNAVLLPIDDSVRDTFGLSAEDAGVFILATAPGGLADAAGLAPGDTIDYVRGEAILSPADLDAVVWNWINTGVSEFVFDGRRAGQSIAATTFITTEIWFTEISVSEIYSWSSYSSESFSYESYYEEYSEEISMSYSESSAEYSEEMTSEDGVDEMTDDEILEQSMAEEATGDYTDDAVDCAGEIIDGVCDEGMDEMTEEPMEDEVVEDEVIDEGGDAGGDEGGDEGYIEE
jgi:hypothetical protein